MADTVSILIRDWMPDYDVRTRHSVVIAAPSAVVYDELLRARFRRQPAVRLLMGIRLLPVLLRHPRESVRRLRTRRPDTSPPLAMIEGFRVLQEIPGREIVLGLTGRFWALSGGLVPSPLEDFPGAIPPGLARAAWSFRLIPLAGSRTELQTETRVRCADDAARRSFRRYWRFVAPGSHLLRRIMLSTVRRHAEAAYRARA